RAVARYGALRGRPRRIRDPAAVRTAARRQYRGPGGVARRWLGRRPLSDSGTGVRGAGMVFGLGQLRRGGTICQGTGAGLGAEADVGVEVTRAFVKRVRERAVGARQVEAVRPGQQVAKLVHDGIARMLGAEVGPDGRLVGPQGAAPLQFNSVGPTLLLLVGLQGSGKTTTAAKLARRLKREQKAPCLVAADVYRPAAREQLEQLGG